MLKNRTKRITVSCILIAAMLLSGIAASFADEDVQYDAESQVSSEQQAEESKPEKTSETEKKQVFEIESEAGAVYCENTGEYIYKKNANRKISPYSITKVLTGLIAVQKLSMDQEITVSKEAAEQEGSVIGLKEGEVVTVKDLLYGLFVVSGNDAAYALAEAVSGDCDSFVELMNDTLKNMGCKDTKFTSPSGLVNDVSEHYTTAKDMIEILKVAFRNKTLRDIAGVKEYTIPATEMSEERVLEGHNELLEKEEFVAGKTGYWDENNCTIVMEYEKKGLHLLVVILGSNADVRSEDCIAMCKYAEKNVKGIKVVAADENVGKARIKHGAKTSVSAYTSEEGFAYLPKAGSKSLIDEKAVIDEDLEAPIKKGDTVGVYRIYVGDEIVNEIKLVSKEDVPEGWIPSYIGISNRTTVIIALVVFLFIMLMIIRSVNKARMRKRKAAIRAAKALEIARRQLEQEEYDRKRGWHI